MSSHTQGALRAAKEAVKVVIEHDGIMECDAQDSAEMFAEIIDRETGVKELAEALQDCLMSCKDRDPQAYGNAKRALAKHKGEHA